MTKNIKTSRKKEVILRQNNCEMTVYDCHTSSIKVSSQEEKQWYDEEKSSYDILNDVTQPCYQQSHLAFGLLWSGKFIVQFEKGNADTVMSLQKTVIRQNRNCDITSQKSDSTTNTGSYDTASLWSHLTFGTIDAGGVGELRFRHGVWRIRASVEEIAHVNCDITATNSDLMVCKLWCRCRKQWCNSKIIVTWQSVFVKWQRETGV